MKAFVIDLRVKGTFFYELSYGISHFEMCYRDMELELESLSDDGYFREFSARFLDVLGNFQSLKQIKIVLEWEEDMDFLLFEVFHRLKNLQMFCVLGLSLQVCTKFKNSKPIVYAGSFGLYVLNLDK